MSNKYFKKKIEVRGHDRFDPRVGKKVAVGKYDRNQRYRNYEEISKTRAKELFNQRPQRAKSIDLKSTSKKVFNVPNEYWEEHINRSDVKGIDTKVPDKWKTHYEMGIGLEGEFGIEKNKTQPLSEEDYALANLGRDDAPSYQEYLKKWQKPKPKKKETSEGLISKIKKETDTLREYRENRTQLRKIQERHIKDTKKALKLAEKELEMVKDFEENKGELKKQLGETLFLKQAIKYENKKPQIEAKIERLKESLQHEKDQLNKIMNSQLDKNIKKGLEIQGKFLSAKVGSKEKEEYQKQLEELTKENVELRDQIQAKKTKKKGFAESLVEDQIRKSKVRTKYQDFKNKLKNSEDWKINTGGIEGLMSKDNIAMYSTNEDFAKSDLGKAVSDARELDLDNQYVILSGALGFYRFTFGREGNSYLKDYIDDALTVMDNPRFYYKENHPLIIKDNKHTFIVAPKVDDDDSLRGNIDDPNAIMSYHEYQELKSENTKKDFLEKIKKINPEFHYHGKGEQKYKDYLLGEYVKHKYGKETYHGTKEMSLEEAQERLKKAKREYDERKKQIKKQLSTKKSEINDDKLIKEIKKRQEPFRRELENIATKLEELDEKNGRGFSRKYRFGILLQNPRGEEQKQLVRKYKDALKKFQYLEGPETQKKIRRKLETQSKLPRLREGEKYYVVSIRDEWADYITHTTNKEKALKEFELNNVLLKKIAPNKKVEIIPAKDIYDVRDKIHDRTRTDYLITGDTYPNRNKIHQLAKVKFDYNEKGFRGKLSTKEIEELKKIPGLKIEKTKEFTDKAKELSDIEKAHSKSRKWLRHEKQEGSIWQKDNPFTNEQLWTWNSVTQFPQDWNKEFKTSVDKKETKILKRLKLDKIEDASEDVQNAFDYYRKNVYDFIQEHNRAKQIAPPVNVVGPAKYPTHKIPKADRIRERASENLQKASKKVDKITSQYINLQPRKTAEEVRQEYREKITPKLIEAKEKGKMVYAQNMGNWYKIKRVNKKTVTVQSKTMGEFTIDKSFIKVLTLQKEALS